MLLKTIRLHENTRECSSENRLRHLEHSPVKGEDRGREPTEGMEREPSNRFEKKKKTQLVYGIQEDKHTWIRKKLGLGLMRESLPSMCKALGSS